MSLPTIFLAFSALSLVAALAALWSSLRVLAGGGVPVVLETARDLPDHAALVEEKNALLRAIKDLEYEREVGKIGEAEFVRLDAAYRAAAKTVLSRLDRDVQPLVAAAEALLVARTGEATPASADGPQDGPPAEGNSAPPPEPLGPDSSGGGDEAGGAA